jgi:hypothetical protein
MVTLAQLALLTPEERSAFRTAAEQVARDENPSLGTTALLVLTIERLLTEQAS